MKHFKWSFIIYFLTIGHFIFAQTNKIDREDFFKEDQLIEAKLSTSFKNLVAEKKDLNYVPGNLTLKFPDKTVFSEDILLKPRGKFRKENCYLASLTVEFRKDEPTPLSSLKKLKMVGGCTKSSNDEQFLLKEYMAYKMYNLLTEMSFRVRLLKVDYTDTEGRSKPYTQYAFFIEDVDDMAKRNKCVEKEDLMFHPESTKRDHSTLVAIFQYMIGNTDWSIPYYHNIKLIVPKTDTFALPYAVPYDFDVTGFVNANYAVPPENLPISSVTERYYRGFPRSMEEIENTLKIFLEKEETIFKMINDFEPFTKSSKNEMTKFLVEFYNTIKNKKNLQRIFIDNARGN